MDFDPLCFFTPCKTTETAEFKRSDTQVEEKVENASHIEPLHYLDLPIIKLRPNEDALMVLLKLFSPGDTLNFTSRSAGEPVEVDEDKVFSDKDISHDQLTTGLEWFSKYCTRFDSKKKLAYVPSLCSSLKENYSNEYNRFLTTIIADDLDWINDSEALKKEASLRLSENCGRSAQPDRIRKIIIDGLDVINLMEPSLTNDNLGLKTWGSSLILSNRLAKNKEYLRRKPLELGSGTGLVGMVSSLLGFTTILTDLKEIIPNLKNNLELNSIDSHAYELDWRDHSTFPINEKFSTILISDPIYSPQHPYWLIETIDAFFDRSDKEARVLLEIPLRPQFENDRQVLWELFKQHGYTEIEHEIEDGYDDFGAMKFCFKMFKGECIV